MPKRHDWAVHPRSYARKLLMQTLEPRHLLTAGFTLFQDLNGGIGDIKGAFVGGLLLGFIEVGVVTVFPSTYRDLFAFTILLLILWMKPTGLFGMPQSTKI